jgi:Cytochrome c554 and c-prime
MRKLCTALALVLLAFPALAPAEMQKAKTIDELAAMFDSTSCKECHEAQYAQWEKSHHARPFMGVGGGMMLTPVVKASAFKVAKAEDATLKTFPCFKCHLPQALRWAEDSVAKELAAALMADPQDKAKVAKLQITCKVCHWEKAIVHKLVEGQPKEGVIYGSKAGAHDDKIFTKMEKSVILKQAIFCGQCHGTGPNFEFDYPVQCATLYGSYQHNYLSNGGLATCQECHMQKKDGVSDHLIAPNFDDKETTQKILAKTINLDVQTLGYQWLRKAGTHIPKVVVNTKLYHTAGHRIPDG